MLLNESFYREEASGKTRWFYPSEVSIRYDDKGQPVGATALEDGAEVQLGGIEKMSKSKNNVVEPRDIIQKFGADTARMFTMFAGPPDQSAAWSDSGAEGSFRYLRRLWAFGVKHADAIRNARALGTEHSEGAQALRRDVHMLLRQISHDYDRLQYNTVVSGAMKLLNALDHDQIRAGSIDANRDRLFKAERDAIEDAYTDFAPVLREGMSILLRTLYPAAPHITHALWGELGFEAALGSLLDAPWPEVDDAALAQTEIELMLQVNGKLRGSIRVPADASKHAIEAAALKSPEFIKFAEGKRPKKVIVVPGRLVNVVV
jgi:leucyl-tRNA synthetase